MMRIRWNDGRIYAGRDAMEVVNAMRLAGLFTRGKTNEEYMEGVSHRLEQLDFFRAPRFDWGAEAFVDDLERFEWIEILNQGE